MSLAGKRDAFTLANLIAGGDFAGVSARGVKAMLSQVAGEVSQLRDIATEVCGAPQFVSEIADTLRLRIS